MGPSTNFLSLSGQAHLPGPDGAHQDQSKCQAWPGIELVVQPTCCPVTATCQETSSGVSDNELQLSLASVKWPI